MTKFFRSCFVFGLLCVATFYSFFSNAVSHSEMNVREQESDPFSVMSSDSIYKDANEDSDQSRRDEDTFETGEESDIQPEASVDLKKGNTSSADSSEGYKNRAKISALDKITGKSKQMIISVGHSEIFGNIEIAIQKCWKAGPPSMDSKILVKVTESRVEEDPKQIFHGWLISNNPAVSNLTHQTYEVFAIDCMNKTDTNIPSADHKKTDKARDKKGSPNVSPKKKQ